MSNKLYLGNLKYDVTDAQLRGMFESFGSVQTAKVAMDRDTARSRGFGFVEMANEQEARAAIAGMHGHLADGRALTVSEANSKANLPAPSHRRSDFGSGGGRREDKSVLSDPTAPT